MLVPCGHTICYTCVLSIQQHRDNLCPICKTRFSKTIKNFSLIPANRNENNNNNHNNNNKSNSNSNVNNNNNNNMFFLRPCILVNGNNYNSNGNNHNRINYNDEDYYWDSD